MASLRSPVYCETLYINYEHVPTAEELSGVKQDIYYRNYNQNEQNYYHKNYTYQPIKSDPELEIIDHDHMSDIFLENESNNRIKSSSTGSNSNNSVDVNVTTAHTMENAANNKGNDRSFDESLNDGSFNESLNDGSFENDDEDMLLVVDRIEEDNAVDISKQRQPLKKKYKCSFCSSSFATINLRKQHESNGHTGAKLFKCDHCDMYFTTQYRKKVHEIKHGSDCPYLCSFCGVGFKSLYKRKLHEKSHSENRPYRCQYCMEFFPTKYRKNIHEIGHISDKPYECRYCDEGFKTQYRCKQHELAHASDKPYQCQFCHESFKSAHKRYIHILSHSGLLNPYQCPKCSMGEKNTAFRTPYKLRAHLAAVHRLEPSDMRNLFQLSTHRDAFVLAKATANSALVKEDRRAAAKKKPGKSSMDLGYLRRLPNDEVLTCFNCSATFGNKLGLISHIRASHTFTFL